MDRAFHQSLFILVLRVRELALYITLLQHDFIPPTRLMVKFGCFRLLELMEPVHREILEEEMPLYSHRPSPNTITGPELVVSSFIP